jgi:hypothetical protein
MRLILLGSVLGLTVALTAGIGNAATRKGNTSSCREVVQANGTIYTGDGRRDRGSFHVVGELRGTNASGRLDFRDRGSNLRIRARDLVGYEVVDDQTRRLTYALSDVEGDVAIVTLRDLGRKGRIDFFEISSGEYLVSGNLRNGNVHLKHRGGDCSGTPDDDGTPDQGTGDN